MESSEEDNDTDTPETAGTTPESNNSTPSEVSIPEATLVLPGGFKIGDRISLGSRYVGWDPDAYDAGKREVVNREYVGTEATVLGPCSNPNDPEATCKLYVEWEFPEGRGKIKSNILADYINKLQVDTRYIDRLLGISD